MRMNTIFLATFYRLQKQRVVSYYAVPVGEMSWSCVCWSIWAKSSWRRRPQRRAPANRGAIRRCRNAFPVPAYRAISWQTCWVSGGYTHHDACSCWPWCSLRKSTDRGLRGWMLLPCHLQGNEKWNTIMWFRWEHEWVSEWVSLEEFHCVQEKQWCIAFKRLIQCIPVGDGEARGILIFCFVRPTTWFMELLSGDLNILLAWIVGDTRIFMERWCPIDVDGRVSMYPICYYYSCYCLFGSYFSERESKAVLDMLYWLV